MSSEETEKYGYDSDFQDWVDSLVHAAKKFLDQGDTESTSFFAHAYQVLESKDPTIIHNLALEVREGLKANVGENFYHSRALDGKSDLEIIKLGLGLIKP